MEYLATVHGGVPVPRRQLPIILSVENFAAPDPVLSPEVVADPVPSPEVVDDPVLSPEVPYCVSLPIPTPPAVEGDVILADVDEGSGSNVIDVVVEPDIDFWGAWRTKFQECGQGVRAMLMSEATELEALASQVP